ncbi:MULTISPECIES: SDR family NAD(P)-dependent oxidoreductase [Legionella]|uniref:SDR family NAD(P)-dependent oxidoreductase n=1 Tax=Legionella TaxID=445 RepID=UPI000F8DEAFC|nr:MULTISPECIES: SDR family NAD(P)-dependent oxidoreductase [Legionella]MCP0913550.1 SDR family NAD(P)-dependent oxidoreductase [Legionella sp. 27cVA30]RUQ99778.1 SDR family NAD(P)-dependent oxidoreductase [Legionella septentrionalis]RUR11028.1 SDR family NAD(P)-dependent oxidoreductase [Legionella septentrionalis]RUR15904.1 SDR family NAD(P)-dependent oxidoreductase [Legionella septentrionalis]
MTKAKQVAVITGAASGIGFALAQNCLREGMRVVLADHDEKALACACRKLYEQEANEFIAVVCDVTQSKDVLRLSEQILSDFARIDLLINNAGICGEFAPVWELSDHQIQRVLDVNLYGIIHGLQVFLPLLFKQNHRSHVVNMASFYGLCSGSQMAAYSMSKHAVVALTESLHFDLCRLEKNVDVSVVCPSFVSTQLLANSAPAAHNTLHQMMSALIERSRPAEDVARHILREIKNKTFYILPDKEIKNDYEQCAQAVIQQTDPYPHSLEKVMVALSKRAQKNKC